MIAEARVVRAAAAYLGFEMNVSSPGPACSIPLSPVISVSGDPFSRRTCSAAAMAESFMDMSEDATKCYTTWIEKGPALATDLRKLDGPAAKLTDRKSVV